MNIMRRHRERELAKLAAATAQNHVVDPTREADGAVGTNASANQAALMLAKLTEDRRRLSDIQSMEARATLKRELLPEYDAWVAGLLESFDQLPEGEPNDVLTTIMLWHIDAGDIAKALEIAEVVLACSIPLPSNFNRSAACVIVEEIAEQAIKSYTLAPEGGVAIDDLVKAAELTASNDMPDVVRAKLSKALATAHCRAANLIEQSNPDQGGDENPNDGVVGSATAHLQSALEAATRALELDANIGVKGMIAQIEKRLKPSGS